jgi:hypothetical protein
MKLPAYVRMVLWSLFGIRRRAAAGEELASVKPSMLLATALCLLAILGVVLWSLVQVAVATLK